MSRMKVTPAAADIVQGSSKKRGTSSRRTSTLSELLSEDIHKPEGDFELGIKGGRNQALREYTEGDTEYPSDYAEYERGRKQARAKFGNLLGLPPEPEIAGAVAIPVPKKTKKGKK